MIEDEKVWLKRGNFDEETIKRWINTEKCVLPKLLFFD